MTSPSQSPAPTTGRSAAGRNAELRATIFHHLDGIVTAPVALALHDKGVLAHLLAAEGAVPLAELTAAFAANEGYLNVALRVLASQGWLAQALNNDTDTIASTVTPAGRAALPRAGLFADVVALLRLAPVHPRQAAPESARRWAAVAARLRGRYDLPPPHSAEAADPVGGRAPPQV
ncbi:MAG: hypothetical protein H7330_02400, partial [Hymenobacteraceae bacterium]|nr:hypothetical protein [Hymenobacteraceae bacterium]